MRVAVITWTSRRYGGTESYLDSVLPVLAQAGHEIGFWCETDGPANMERIRLGEGTRFWVAENDPSQSVRELANWKPDLLYVHGLENPERERELQSIAPGLFFAHNYYGTCISGLKTRRYPTTAPCTRRFGPGCLACYLPQRCGGLNPWTMWTQYRLQTKRLRLLAGYRMLVTHSEHMQQEYRNHGLQAEVITYYASVQTSSGEETLPLSRRGATGEQQPWRLLFLGRFDPLKGGGQLLKSLPQVCRNLGSPVHVTLAGEGPCRSEWESLAAGIQRENPACTVEMPGWVSLNDRDALLRRSDLLVVPSLWPEPFGRVGPEAGSAGLPVVAYDVGGVRAWLTDGVNGILAPGTPPTVAGLAQAITRALADPHALACMRVRARELATRFTMANHVRELAEIFDKTMAAPARIQGAVLC